MKKLILYMVLIGIASGSLVGFVAPASAQTPPSAEAQAAVREFSTGKTLSDEDRSNLEYLYDNDPAAYDSSKQSIDARTGRSTAGAKPPDTGPNKGTEASGCIPSA